MSRAYPVRRCLEAKGRESQFFEKIGWRADPGPDGRFAPSCLAPAFPPNSDITHPHRHDIDPWPPAQTVSRIIVSGARCRSGLEAVGGYIQRRFAGVVLGRDRLAPKGLGLLDQGYSLPLGGPPVSPSM